MLRAYKRKKLILSKIFLASIILLNLVGCFESPRLNVKNENDFKDSLLEVSSSLNKEEMKIVQYLINKYEPLPPKTKEEIFKASRIHDKTAEELLSIGKSDVQIAKTKFLSLLQSENKRQVEKLKEIINSYKQLTLKLINTEVIDEINTVFNCKIECRDLPLQVNIEVSNNMEEAILNSTVFIKTAEMFGVFEAESKIAPKKKQVVSFRPQYIRKLQSDNIPSFEHYSFLVNELGYESQTFKIQNTHISLASIETVNSNIFSQYNSIKNSIKQSEKKILTGEVDGDILEGAVAVSFDPNTYLDKKSEMLLFNNLESLHLNNGSHIRIKEKMKEISSMSLYELAEKMYQNRITVMNLY